MVDRYYGDHPWTSLNQTLKEIGKLKTDRRYRDARGAFFMEGVRHFVQAADHDSDMITVIYSEKLLTSPLARKLVRQKRRAGVPTVRVKPEIFRRFSETRRASGVSAILRQRWSSLESANLEAGLCWIVLGLVRSAGNLGTLIRTSEAVGGAGFILLDQAVDLYHPVAVRASMSAHFRQHYIRTTPPVLQAWLRQHQGQLIGVTPDGAQDFHHYVFPRPTLLFLGEERGGLTPRQRALCDETVRIPMVGLADSLNLGVAGSLMMYELFRARSGYGDDRS